MVKTSDIKEVPSKITDRMLSKEDEITASIKAGNALLSISSEKNIISTKPKRKSDQKVSNSKPNQPDPAVPKPDSSSQKRKAFKPKQGSLPINEWTIERDFQ